MSDFLLSRIRSVSRVPLHPAPSPPSLCLCMPVVVYHCSALVEVVSKREREVSEVRWAAAAGVQPLERRRKVVEEEKKAVLRRQGKGVERNGEGKLNTNEETRLDC